MKDFNNINKTNRDDMAFFNSVLSYGIYTDREWMLGLNTFGQTTAAKSFDETVTEAAFELLQTEALPKELMKRNYELYLSSYIKNNFTKFSLQDNEEVDFSSTKYGYKTKCQFQESDYFALNNLARAGYFLSQNEDGSQNMHLVFRGTDNKARNFMDFVGKAYLDMSAYYDAFKPLEEKILAFAKDPSNNIKTVHVSGHSLGGSMVQEFFNSTAVKKSGLDLVGFTYGSPGTDKKPLHDLVTETYYTVKKFLKTHKISAFSELAINTIGPTLNRLLPNTLAFTNIVSTTTLGFNFLNVINQSTPALSKLDTRIFQYEHSGDLIPKLGSAVYNEKGEEIYLKDVASKNVKETFMLTGRQEYQSKHKFFSFVSQSFNFFIKKPIRYINNMFKFEYHDMMRYVINLEHKIVTDNTKSNSPYYNQFINYKERFLLNTSHKNEDVTYQKILGKEISSPVTQINHVRIPKDLQYRLNNFQYFQTSNSIVSDILGKNISYDLKNFNIAGTNQPVDTSIPDIQNSLISELAKHINTDKNKEQNYKVIFKNTSLNINNIQELRDKFLNSPKVEKKLTF